MIKGVTNIVVVINPRHVPKARHLSRLARINTVVPHIVVATNHQNALAGKPRHKLEQISLVARYTETVAQNLRHTVLKGLSFKKLELTLAVVLFMSVFQLEHAAALVNCHIAVRVPVAAALLALPRQDLIVLVFLPDNL
jgi:hypothetical protein